MARLPQVGGDKGNWGDILNDYLKQAHADDGTLKAGIVGAPQLKPSSVTGDALASNSVNASKIAEGAVGAAQLADGSVTRSKVAGAGQADGIATLDRDGRLPETQVPTRLEAPELSNTIVTVADAMPEAYLNAISAPNGAITSITHGELSASFGNSPATVTGDRITHSPTTASNSAAYIQADIGGPCRRVGMEFEIPNAGNGTLAIVIPNTSWAGGIVNAGLHTTVTAAGIVSSGRNVGGTNTGTNTTRVGPLTGVHSIEALLDDVREEITILLDGVEVLRYTDAIAFTMLSDFAIWELFQANGTSGVPSFIRSAWAGKRTLIPPTARGARIERVRKGYGNTFATPASISLPTTYRAVLGIGALGVYFPPSGRLLCEYEVWISANALTAGVRRVYGSIASSQDKALMYGGQLGLARCRTIVSGTPGALQILSPQMWAEDASGTVTATISATSGPAVMMATPIEAVVPTS
ncbi:hypothetical protein ACCO44_11360 [Microbacterium maritypicum]|uniref:hypothetical protein n=1 Tax=Microbacterium maritypicum TaxID=33918 RepID=UPI0035576672